MRREKQLRLVITFRSTMEAMSAEAAFVRHGLAGRLIPVPGEIKAGCGLAWMAPCETREMLTDRMANDGISYEQMDEYLI